MRPPVVGRESELAAIDATLRNAHGGFTSLVLEGEPGIGKSTLWTEAIDRAAGLGFHVLSARATSAEAKLALTGVADLLATVDAGVFQALPEPQRHALNVALLRVAPGDKPLDVRTLGTALVSVIHALSESAPVLVALDDLQWFDRSSMRLLEFATRRLDGGRASIIATVRISERDAVASILGALTDGAGMTLEVGPLDAATLSRIVTARLGYQLPGPLAARIQSATRGNPFSAVEIGRQLQRDRGLAAGAVLPVPEEIQGLVVKRLRALPAPTQRALARASALARPTVHDLGADSLEPAEADGIVVIDAAGRVEFAHPLFAEAVYHDIETVARRRLHRDLADVVANDEERARHRALATVGVDDDAAVAAFQRGAPDVAADLADWALTLTSGRGTTHWMLALKAARFHVRSGNPARALELARDVVDRAPPSAVRAAGLQIIAECLVTNDLPGAVAALQSALEDVDVGTHQDAEIHLQLSLVSSGLLDIERIERYAERALAVAESTGPGGLISAALAARAIARFVNGKGADEAELERALALEDPDWEVAFQLRSSFNVAQMYAWIGRVDNAHALFEKLRADITDRGLTTDLPWVLGWLGGVALLAGNPTAALQYAESAKASALLTAQPMFHAYSLAVTSLAASTLGDLDTAEHTGAESFAVSNEVGWAFGITQAVWVLAVVDAAREDPAAAARRLAPVLDGVEAGGVYEWPLAMPIPDGIEALIASNQLGRAEELLEAFSAFGVRVDRPWILATAGRCGAQLFASRGDLDRALVEAERAVSEHDRLPLPFELARTLLVLGQLQRRCGERRAARATLTRAQSIFTDMGARLWAERTGSELRRIGVRKAPTELTENELRVASLAATGLTNPEIATQLFIGRRTVESNLSRAYRKLGIRSRAELGAVMADRNRATE